MAKEKAPAQLTGGAGFEFEDSVAARFLIDLITAGPPFGVGLGQVVKIAWQARESGWLADDLVVTCRLGTNERQVALSVKSNPQVTGSGFPKDFARLAWEQWRGLEGAVALKGTANAVGLVVGGLGAGVEEAWNKLSLEVRESHVDLQRVLERLTPPTPENPRSQSSEIERELVASLACPPEVVLTGGSTPLESLELISQLHVLHFDFRSPSSRQEGLALTDCRALLVSGDEADAQRLWTFLRAFAGRKRQSGGTTILADLLDELRSHFALREHPDFDADWRMLDGHARDAMEMVSTEIHGLGSLARSRELGTIRKAVAEGKVALLVGQSGVGKSGLAKLAAVEGGARPCWLTADMLDFDSAATIEEQLGLRNPLVAVLTTAPTHCTVVVDGIEKFSVRAQQRLEQLLRRLFDQPSPHVRVVLTVQPDGDRAIACLIASGIARERIARIQVAYPGEEDVRALLSSEPSLHWASLNPSLRPVLRNLKIADWVARAVRAGALLDPSKIVNVSALIDWLWNCAWIGGADDGDERSSLLMRLATKESESLSAGVPRTALEPGEQKTLRGLQQAGALFRRYERLFFQHDLLGDWSRLRVLMAEHPLTAAAMRERAANPRWHNAVRLYGLWLLEYANDGSNHWKLLIDEAQRVGDLGLRDLLLESVLIASDVSGMLHRTWPVLIADEGKLLESFLDRFLYAATVPDPRIAHWVAKPAAVAEIEHAFRVPVEAQWRPVLDVLRTQMADVVQLSPLLVARVVCLWLRATPVNTPSPSITPWRRKAAELAVAIAREVQARHAEGVHFTDHGDQIVFEALLHAAPDLPAEVSALCLELAERRDDGPDIRERAERAKHARQEENKRWKLENPELAAKRAILTRSALPRGALRQPWPDGPRAKVRESFRDACLDANAFVQLVRVAPDVALEVLLAVCIEEPQHENPYNASHEDVGLAHWRKGYPALYFRGPFLRFLQLAPEQGLSFALRLVNFATERHVAYLALAARRFDADSEIEAANIYVPVELKEQAYPWYGDGRTFQWHYWSTVQVVTVVVVLQALEKWLYDELEAGHDVAPALARVMAESRSLAFAGVLVDVGKSKLELFETVLLPLLGVAEIYGLDSNSALHRSLSTASEMIPWNGQSEPFFSMARDWYAADHRKLELRHLADDLLQRPPVQAFFERVRSIWAERAGDSPPDSSLRLLIERFNPLNYTETKDDQGNVHLELQWPEATQRAIDGGEQARMSGLLVTQVAMRCRELLKVGQSLEAAHRDGLWKVIREVLPSGGEGAKDVQSAFGVQDAVCAGLAVLLTLHREWIEADAERLAWCRAYLESTFEADRSGYAFGEEAALGDLHADCYAADCGLALVVRDSADVLARKLVARAVVAVRYVATEHVVTRAYAIREHLGDDFARILVLAVSWAAERGRHDRLSFIEGPSHPRTSAGSDELAAKFVTRDLSPELPAICELNKTIRVELVAAARERRRLAGRPDREDESLTPALDARVIKATFPWLRLSEARSPKEKDEWTRLLADLLAFSLEGAQSSQERLSRRPEHSGPHEFDYWVLRLVATNLSGIENPEKRQALWARVLDLGPNAQHWVTAFLSAWLSSGYGASASRVWFTDTWSRMIRYALRLETWAVRYTPDYELGQMAVELLGFNGAGRRAVGGQDGASILGTMLPVFEEAAERWLELPYVARAFASFAASVGDGALLVVAVRLLHSALTHEDVRADEELDAHLVDFLRACWQHERPRIQQDSELTKMFMALLTHAAGRGSHAAAALRDQIVGSLAVG